eukprot:1002451-Rhodomonas_salina.1
MQASFFKLFTPEERLQQARAILKLDGQQLGNMFEQCSGVQLDPIRPVPQLFLALCTMTEEDYVADTCDMNEIPESFVAAQQS